MKKLVTLLLVFLLINTSMVSLAEELDIGQMTYEELTVLRKKIDDKMEELMRQYAIENGNRTITLNYTELSLFEKTRKQIIPSVERIVEDAPEKTDIVWFSSDEAVVTVSSDGRVSAVSAGSAVITCAAADDEYIFAELPVKVGLRVTAVGLSTEELTLHLPDTKPVVATHQLKAILTPENALCQEVRWTSSNEEIATVDDNGVIYAKKPGKVVIRATSNEEVSGDQKQKTRSCDVTVVRDVASITLDQEAVNIKKGSSVSLAASVLPEDASNKKISWESSDETVATVSVGKVTGKACGTCQIICRATDGSEVYTVCDVTVYQPVTSLKLSKESLNLLMGVPTFVKADVMPKDATNGKVIWSSSDNSVATANDWGMIIATGVGTCEIICETTDGSEVSAKMTVRVPALAVLKDNYTVVSKKGLTIPVEYYGKEETTISMTVGNERVVSAEFVHIGEQLNVRIEPVRAGTTTITLQDDNNKADTVKFNVTVEDSAVFSTKSYPKASYEDILRYPMEHYGDAIHIYGRVLQKMKSGSNVMLRVGTTNRYYDSVFYVEYSTDNIDTSVIEDDYVTIYGRCTGDKTYETVLGGEVTIPSMRAEKIVVGKKSN